MLPARSYQEVFHQRWAFLHDTHVRALAWLLDAPGLLNPHAPRWNARIATLGPANDAVALWLRAQDADPTALHSVIQDQPSTRLGRYAEKLLTFYFQCTGQLIAHNVQVRNGPGDTVGEFDFLIRDEMHEGTVHWEFATKFYLLESQQTPTNVEAFVGPNLADSLGAKMDKIMRQQLKLSEHSAAAAYLTQPVKHAQALVKGWLFYRVTSPAAHLPATLGISAEHCRGFWCELPLLDLDETKLYLILPRLEWLAPARSAVLQALSAGELRIAVAEQLQQTLAPVMIAECVREGAFVLEKHRGFVVPADWQKNAAHRVRHSVVTF